MWVMLRFRRSCFCTSTGSACKASRSALASRSWSACGLSPTATSTSASRQPLTGLPLLLCIHAAPAPTRGWSCPRATPRGTSPNALVWRTRRLTTRWCKLQGFLHHVLMSSWSEHLRCAHSTTSPPPLRARMHARTS